MDDEWSLGVAALFMGDGGSRSFSWVDYTTGQQQPLHASVEFRPQKYGDFALRMHPRQLRHPSSRLQVRSVDSSMYREGIQALPLFQPRRLPGLLVAKVAVPGNKE
jgi:hypothetical protein